MANRLVKLPNIKTSDASWVLSEFFEKDRKRDNFRIRISVLLSAKKDLKFLRGVFLDDISLNLNKSQKDELMSQLPRFAVILVFCSVVDLLARVSKGKVPGNRENKEFFLFSCRRWFKLSQAQSKALWEFRNSVSHQYTILPKTRTLPHGFNGVMKYDKKHRVWEYNLNGMYSSTINASDRVREYINNLGDKTKTQRAKFIYLYGFIYTPAV